MIEIPTQSECYGNKLHRYQVLSDGWQYSVEMLQRGEETLEQAIPPAAKGDVTLFLAGSFGRLEAGPASDADLIMVARNPSIDTEPVLNRAIDALRGIGMRMPNKKGVFQQAFSLTSLIEATGGTNDRTESLSHRMLLLMEARCVFNSAFGAEVIRSLYDMYFSLHADEPDKQATFLLNDAVRYFREICLNYQFNFGAEREKWALRNTKLRHSRIIMFAGLLLLILKASADKWKADKKEYLLANHEYPPLARILKVLDEMGRAEEAVTVLDAYARFIGVMNDPEERSNLQLEYAERGNHPLYSSLKENSDNLIRAVADAIYGERRKGRWSDEIFDYLIL